METTLKACILYLLLFHLKVSVFVFKHIIALIFNQGFFGSSLILSFSVSSKHSLDFDNLLWLNKPIILSNSNQVYLKKFKRNYHSLYRLYLQNFMVCSFNISLWTSSDFLIIPSTNMKTGRRRLCSFLHICLLIRAFCRHSLNHSTGCICGEKNFDFFGSLSNSNKSQAKLFIVVSISIIEYEL